MVQSAATALTPGTSHPYWESQGEGGQDVLDHCAYTAASAGPPHHLLEVLPRAAQAAQRGIPTGRRPGGKLSKGPVRLA